MKDVYCDYYAKALKNAILHSFVITEEKDECVCPKCRQKVNIGNRMTELSASNVDVSGFCSSICAPEYLANVYRNEVASLPLSM